MPAHSPAHSRAASRARPPAAPKPAQLRAQQAFAAVESFLRIETASGAVLLIAAAAALIWANSPFAAAYHHFWELPVTLGLGSYSFSQSLHFWVNDGLMTIFFLVVGMEIRREMHDGALSNAREAVLPIAAALGGVVAPAVLYLALNFGHVSARGWAVPTATDIAFAVGVLALLGRSIPRSVRIFLLTLAIIDDVIAVLIIAAFYSAGLQPMGLLIVAAAIAMVLGLQRIGIGSAFAYIVPGAVMWSGLLVTGVHPTLAGVMLGLLTPVRAASMTEQPIAAALTALRGLRRDKRKETEDVHAIARHMRELHVAKREMLPPVSRVEDALHPWVAFAIMPIFALANAGVSVGGVDLAARPATLVMAGIALALVVGKPLGIVGVSWLAVRLGLCRLPSGITWGGIWLVGLLAGIGFTMSIFIALLGFTDPNLLGAAKLGILIGSLAAALLGVGWGAMYLRQRRAGADPDADPAAGLGAVRQ